MYLVLCLATILLMIVCSNAGKLNIDQKVDGITNSNNYTNTLSPNISTSHESIEPDQQPNKFNEHSSHPVRTQSTNRINMYSALPKDDLLPSPTIIKKIMMLKNKAKKQQKPQVQDDDDDDEDDDEDDDDDDEEDDCPECKKCPKCPKNSKSNGNLKYVPLPVYINKTPAKTQMPTPAKVTIDYGNSDYDISDYLSNQYNQDNFMSTTETPMSMNMKMMNNMNTMKMMNNMNTMKMMNDMNTMKNMDMSGMNMDSGYMDMSGMNMDSGSMDMSNMKMMNNMNMKNTGMNGMKMMNNPKNMNMGSMDMSGMKMMNNPKNMNMGSMDMSGMKMMNNPKNMNMGSIDMSGMKMMNMGNMGMNKMMPQMIMMKIPKKMMKQTTTTSTAAPCDDEETTKNSKESENMGKAKQIAQMMEILDQLHH